MLRAWPLRRRLLVILTGLGAVGLTTFAASGVFLLDRSLTARGDQQLIEMAEAAQRSDRMPPLEASTDELPFPTEFSLTVYGSSGDLLRQVPEDAAEGPEIDAGLVESAPSDPVTVPGRAGGSQWRVVAVELSSGEVVFFAMSLDSQEGTVDQLLLIQVVVGVVVLVLLIGAGYVAVRLGLRPLSRMETAAKEIAGGNTELRVPDDDLSTETGRLAAALNTMLDRLGEALRQRERSERRLRQFVADASHELRTPLTSIRGFAELYRHGRVARDPATERIFSRVESEADRMGVLVEDLLLLARLDHERALDLSDVDLPGLVDDVLHDARARYPGSVLLQSKPSSRVRLLGDDLRLRQVVANLVSNAVMHSPDGTPVHVEVGTRTVDSALRPATVAVGNTFSQGAETVFIAVRDEGPGIGPDDLPYVFDRFYRVVASRTGGGTGLGLAIVAALVEAHEGRIELTSRPGYGTTVLVLLPAVGPNGT